MYYYFPSTGMNETIYYYNHQMYYLESIAELIKVLSSIEHPSVET